ncbi:phosphotransferase [Luteimicrobium sp. NPDC057192]|uniref:phosphotransferase n=1 Tax=Luteimicrobium sp. NPDC057192 TaxID=3346042 RepID=UPI0036369CAD
MSDPLGGGTRTEVRRVGDHVVRAHHRPPSPYAHPTLELLGARGWGGAPRLVAAGPPEELTFLAGAVPPRGPVPAWARTSDALRALGRLVRELHDLTAGTELVGDAETMCHNDLSPANTVYRPTTLLPYAFVDWDLAAPGTRVADLGHAAWQWLDLGPRADVTAARRGLRSLLDGYGSDLGAREVVAAAARWQRETASGIEDGAATDPTLAALNAAGVPADCRAAAGWTDAHLAELSAPDVLR